MSTSFQPSYDSSLFFRVEGAVETMIRARWSYNARMKSVMSQLRPIREGSVPPEIRNDWETVLNADVVALCNYPSAPAVLNYGLMTPRQRDQWSRALLRCYKHLLRQRMLYFAN
jgi:hypothetical protein